MLAQQGCQMRVRDLIAPSGPVAHDVLIHLPEPVFLCEQPYVRQAN